MKIELSAAGKRFNYDWIFRNVNLTLTSGTSYAITGPNGSGKSTLLQAIGGLLQLSEGAVHYSTSNKSISPENVFEQAALCAPYIDVIEEMTLTEFFDFHAQFKPFIKGLSTASVIETVGMTQAKAKQIRYYSSGMKQRVKLAQAILSDAPLLLLDEPCSNLDAAGIDQYHSLIKTYGNNRIIIVCSNDPVEYDFCQTILSMADFKTSLIAK
ncbi:MAG: ATP-binding cassette protein [Flaviaesturariibacter sp.]|nr:ATP-binding cassette protein [Flaviaesturariibacter sp.]